MIQLPIVYIVKYFRLMNFLHEIPHAPDGVIKLRTKYEDDLCVGRRLKLYGTALGEGDDGNVGFKYRLFPALVRHMGALPGGWSHGRRSATATPHLSPN